MGEIIKNKKLFISCLIFGIFLANSVVLAAEFKLLVKWPPSPLGTSLTGASKIPDLIKYFYEWGISLGGIACLFALVIAGFQYLTSLGQPQPIKEAQGRIQAALLGLVLILASWLLLRTINPELTTLRPVEFKPPEEKISPYQLCETDADCPTRYECKKGAGEKKGICLPKPPSMKPCKKVILNDKVIEPAKKCKNFSKEEIIQAGTVLYARSEPNTKEGCAGYLQLFGQEKCEDLRYTVDVNVQGFVTDADIRSVLLFAP